MSLRKPPTLTPTRLEANRRNGKKSTGPRTARGKGQSRMNSLRTGTRSRFMRGLYMALYDAPIGGVDRVAREILSPEMAAHPLFADLVEMFGEADIATTLEHKAKLRRAVSRKPPKDVSARQRLTGAEVGPSAGPNGRWLDPRRIADRLLTELRAKPECY